MAKVQIKQIETTDGSQVAVAAGDSAVQGTSSSVAHKDHQHAVTTGGSTATITASTTAAEGTGALAREDHGHVLDVTSGSISTVNAGDAAANGSAIGVARRDHQHAVATAVVVAVGTANAEGASTSLARANHVHDHGSQTTPGHHAIAIASGNAGFMSGADKAKLDGLSGGSSTVQEEITTQAISGADTAMTDTLASVPVGNSAVEVFLNGLIQRQGAGLDYTLSSQTITWLASTGTAVDQETTDTMTAVYLT